MAACYSGPVEMRRDVHRRLKPKTCTRTSRKQVIKGRGSVGKTAVVGAKDRQTNRVSAAVIDNVDQPERYKGSWPRMSSLAQKSTLTTTEVTSGLLNHETIPPLSEGVRQRASPLRNGDRELLRKCSSAATSERTTG